MHNILSVKLMNCLFLSNSYSSRNVGGQGDSGRVREERDGTGREKEGCEQMSPVQDL